MMQISRGLFGLAVAAALGLGVAPASRAENDGCLLVQEGAAGEAVPAAPHRLDHFMTVTLHGDYVAEGVGLLGKTEADIVVDSIPDGAELVGAVLYWAVLDGDVHANHGRLRLNNVLADGEYLGQVSNCWFRRQSFAYRAVLSREDLLSHPVDPTVPLPPAPSGNGIYRLWGFGDDPSEEWQGATLVLVYEHEELRARDVVFYDGNVLPVIGPPPPFWYTTAFPITSYAAEAPVEGQTTFIVGNGSERAWDHAAFENARGRRRYAPANPFRSLLGPHWDTQTISLNGLVTGGEQDGRALVTVVATPVGGGWFALDCLIWAAQVTSVTTSHPVDPDPGAWFTGF
jgi:hypothetical protein